jgi:hypothetical protein
VGANSVDYRGSKLSGGGVAKPNSALRAAERRELTLAGVVEQEGHLSQQQERLRQRVR